MDFASIFAAVTVLEVIQRSGEFLARKGVDSPRLQIELLLAHVLQMPRMKLYLNFERPLSEPELETLRGLVRRRGAREPLQHLVGSTSFCGHEIEVSPDVLIPRPETELLAEQAWQFLANRAGELTVLDFGTGSGCLAIALAKKVSNARIHAVDISEPALAVARRNAARNEVESRVEFVCGDGFNVVPAATRFDLVVSNPPYIPSAEIAELQPEVRDFDPRLALDGGVDGLDFYRHLSAKASAWLKPGGRLMWELGDGQGSEVSALLNEDGWVVERLEKDYSGRERILIARRGD